MSSDFEGCRRSYPLKRCPHPFLPHPPPTKFDVVHAREQDEDLPDSTRSSFHYRILATRFHSPFLYHVTVWRKRVPKSTNRHLRVSHLSDTITGHGFKITVYINKNNLIFSLNKIPILNYINIRNFIGRRSCQIHHALYSYLQSSVCHHDEHPIPMSGDPKFLVLS